MDQAIEAVKSGEITYYHEYWLSKEAIEARVNKIREVLKSQMKKDVHFGTIPGTPKPTLYKPGSELLLTTFKIAREPIPTDLSTQDEVRYRVEVRGTSMDTGSNLGSGVGECSSNEEKYKWRSPVCAQEFEDTPEDRKRKKWKKVWDKSRRAYGAKLVDQVRTEPSDIANTILKMATKRAQIDLTLNVLAASEVFTQDMEDVPEEVRDNLTEPSNVHTASPPKPKSSSPQGGCITEPQGRRLFAISRSNGVSDEQLQGYLLNNYNIQSSSEIKRSDYEAICAWAEKGGQE